MDTHDAAVIGSVKCRIELPYTDAVTELKRRMKCVSDFVEERGGLVGHIKAFVHEDARACMVSMTDSEEAQVKETSGFGVTLEAAHIVFGVESAELEKLLRELYL